MGPQIDEGQRLSRGKQSCCVGNGTVPIFECLQSPFNIHANQPSQRREMETRLTSTGINSPSITHAGLETSAGNANQ